MIVCFTGTGNSLAVAKELARHTGEAIRLLEGEALMRPEPLRLSPTEDVTWVFPIYSWGVPPVMARYIEDLPLEGGRCHHLVCTCGDDVGLADRQWRTLIERRGWAAKSAFSVEMPNTYVLMRGFDVDSPQVAHAKLDAMPKRVSRIAELLDDEEIHVDVVRGKFAWLKSRVIYPWFVRHAMSPRPFHATNACVGCARCATTCPMLNIEMTQEHRPRWSDHCALCLRCYHICPVHAVAYGKVTTDKKQKPVKLRTD